MNGDKVMLKILLVFLGGLFLTTGYQAFAEEYNVVIPFGAYNPELNTPAEEWFSPSKISIKIGDTITWLNDDREGHTITSGQGSGGFGWMSDDFGTPDGYFDSGRFMPNESWSFTFEKSGVIPYFCTIHPWMEAVVIVEKSIPDFPHDATGNKIDFPLVAYTPDTRIEVDLTWEPHVIKTHELIKFIYQFYDPATNSNLAKMNYEFVIFQNGKEVHRDRGINEIGGDYRNFVFEESGSIIIRFENIHNPNVFAEESTIVEGSVSEKFFRTVDFTGVVYSNPEKSTHEEFQISPAQRLEFHYELAIAIILIPAVVFIFIIFWMKKKPEIKKSALS
jgi:plastocyanin